VGLTVKNDYLGKWSLETKTRFVRCVFERNEAQINLLNSRKVNKGE